LLGREGQARAAAFKAQGKDVCMHAHMHACVLTRFHTGLYTVSILHSHAGPYTRDSLPPCTLKSLHTKDFLHTDAQASTSSHAQVCIHSLHTLTRRSQAAHPCSSAYTLSHKDLLAHFAHIHTQISTHALCTLTRRSSRTLCAHSHKGLQWRARAQVCFHLAAHILAQLGGGVQAQHQVKHLKHPGAGAAL